MMNKTEKIVQAIAADIGEGILMPGQRIASVRQASEVYDVSKNTIIEAYERLAAKGLISAKRGSGYYVCERRLSIRETSMPPPRHVLEAVDRISLLQSQLNQDFAVRVGDGRPPASWMEGAIPSRLIKQFFQPDGSDRSGYGSFQGHTELRELIAARNRLHNINASANQIVTTFGANHGLDLIIRRYLVPGDTVLVDDPGYYPLFAKLELAQVRFVGVRRTAVGPDLDDLQKKAEQENPAFFFTQSTGQNPTGSSIDLPTAHGVLQIANKTGMIVVDDDPFVDLPNGAGIRLASLDQFQSMIFVGSFSKVISASFRSGYIIAPANIAAEIAESKLITSINSSRFSEMMIAEMIKSRRYHKHLQKLDRRLGEAQGAYMSRIDQLGLELFTRDTHGYYSYIILPPGVCDLEFARDAARAGIFIAPSTPFAVQKDPHVAAIRINITRADDTRFFNFMRNYFKNIRSKGNSTL